MVAQLAPRFTEMTGVGAVVAPRRGDSHSGGRPVYRDIGEFSPAEAIQHPNVEKTHDANVEYADILGPSSQVVPSVKIHELSPLNDI